MLNPRNRHLLVVPQEAQEEEQDRAVLLPENYRKPQSPYVAVSVLAVAPDVSQLLMAGDVLMVERSMLKEVTFQGESFYLVLENYILGIVEQEI
jgi:co-chaperonin GroES (HSP10)|tara:strand:+ start:318 stop:599 length:282 start_codon:yes stop_codon:yes gene_type:complete